MIGISRDRTPNGAFRQTRVRSWQKNSRMSPLAVLRNDMGILAVTEP
jgi:hypothetical protein